MQCRACGHPRGGGRYFCGSCGVLLSDPTQSAHAASRGTRLGGWVLDYAILNLTFGIGWIIWHNLHVATRAVAGQGVAADAGFTESTGRRPG